MGDEVYFTDDVGHSTAIFANLVRGEFHCERASDMRQVEVWPGNAHFPSLESCLLLDGTGQLAP